MLLFFLIMTAKALAWGEQGHRGISDAVQTHLTPQTRSAIAHIMGTGEELPPDTLGRLSLWPDKIRILTKNPHATIAGFTPEEMSEARSFVTNHPDNANWHFVDLPPGSAHYPDLANPDMTDPALPFTTSNDIVHMIHATLEVLESTTASPGFTRLQALRWLLHLTQDIHQPLHVASGYYLTTPAALLRPNMLSDPAEVTKSEGKNDRGGNVLLFLKTPACPTKSTSQNLHSVWDDCLVDMVAGAKGCKSPTTDEAVTALAELLKTHMADPALQEYRSSGDYHHWAEQWATDAVHVAAARVFPSELDSGCLIRDQKVPHQPIHVQSRIVRPSSKKTYMETHKPDAEVQLVKAAVRLTDLLNHIQWKD